MSVSQQGVAITNRFFLAIDTMIQQGRIKSLRQVTEMYGLNYGNTYTIRKKPETFILKPELIAKLCQDFNVSAEWILLGIEPMFYHKRKCLKNSK